MSMIIHSLHWGRRTLLKTAKRLSSTPLGKRLREGVGKEVYQAVQPRVDGLTYDGAFSDAVWMVKFGRSSVVARTNALPQMQAALERFLRHIFQEEFKHQIEPRLQELAKRLVKSCRNPDELNQVVANLSKFDARDEFEGAAPVSKKPLKKDNLRILVVSGMFPSVDHGGGLRLFDIVSELAKRHEIELYSIYSEELDQKSMLRLKDRVQAMRLVGESSFHFGDLVNWLGRRGKFLNDFDVLQFEYPHSMPIIVECAKYPLRTAFTLMEGVTRRFSIDLLFFLQNDPSKTPELIKCLLDYFRIEKTALKHVDHGIAVSAADADFAARVFDVPRPTVISTGISPELFADESGGAGAVSEAWDRARQAATVYEKSAAFLGYYGHTPNIEGMEWYLTKVHPKVQARIPGFKIYVIGRGDTSHLQKLVPSDDKSVVFTGRVENIIEWLVKARICLLPLHTGSGLRGKINQYSAAGRPSVSTSIGICGTPYVHNESVLEANEADEFADCMIRLIEDEELWKRIQGESHELVVKHCSWPSLIVDLEKLYYA